ncbi:MAG: YgjV family protein [Alphaproteobacteria bacterium]|nr:YgjV family protein [Alphaproteobacteria bacterium]
MSMDLIIGNIFSLFSAICIAISVIKKSKKDLMYWQIGDTFFGIIANIALSAYAALVISVICFIRNILSYKDKLTINITYILLILSVVIGLYANNRGVIGWLPIIASASYTICVYVTKNEQQMRWALVFNLMLWFVHNAYVQAYPSAIANIVLCFWTALNIFKNKK